MEMSMIVEARKYKSLIESENILYEHPLHVGRPNFPQCDAVLQTMSHAGTPIHAGSPWLFERSGSLGSEWTWKLPLEHEPGSSLKPGPRGDWGLRCPRGIGFWTLPLLAAGAVG